MKTGWMCGLAKLRKKKLSGILLGMCIAMTAALLVNTLVMLKKVNVIFDKAYEEMGGAHLCCLWSHEMFALDYVKGYLDNLHGEFTYQITENTKTIEYIEKDGIKLSNGILLELPKTLEQDMLSPRVPDDLGINMPGEGEIWITTKLSHILHIKEGDELFLQMADETVKVKAVKIVTDTVFGSSATNVYRMWCGYGRLEDFPVSSNNAVSYLELKFDKYSRSAEQDFIRETEQYFDMPLGSALYTYDKIKGGYTMVYQMIGAVLCFVSVVLAVTMIALTVFLIKSDVEEDIRNIGIYQSLGMTKIQIIVIYLTVYGVVGVLGAVLGSVLGGRFSIGMITGILKDIGIDTVTYTGIIDYQFLVCAAVSFSVLAICFHVVFKLHQLNIAYAVRTGIWQTEEQNGKGQNRKEQKTFRYHEKMSFTFYYAIKGMQNKKLRYGYIAGVSLILSCLVTVSTGCLNAVQNIDKEPAVWGFIRTDIYVTSLSATPVSSILKTLEKDERVDYTYGVNKIYVTYQPYQQDVYQSITTETYELPWNEKIKDESIQGRRPERTDEIGIGLGLARLYGLEAGDTIELFVNGKKGAYTITGIFQTLSNSGNVIRMVTDNLDKFMKADSKCGDYMLVLDSGVDKWEYAAELTEKYGEDFAFIASKSNGENFTSVLAPAAGMIVIVLSAVAALITMNLTFLLVRREHYPIGLLKAIGMTSGQVLKIYIGRNCLSAAAGACLGMITGVLIIPPLLTPYARQLGLTKFPFAASLTGTLAGFILPVVCMLLSTCAVIRAINAISVKRMLNE